MIRNRLPILLLLVISACSETSERGGDSQVVVSVDSVGNDIVTNIGPDRPLNWAIGDTVFVIGGPKEDDLSLSRITEWRLTVDEQDQLTILDVAGSRVLVVDGEGRLASTFGSEGEGPGEFTAPVAVSRGPSGTIDVFDAAVAGFHRFQPDGSFQEVVDLGRPVSGGRAKWGANVLYVTMFARRSADQTSIWTLWALPGGDPGNLRRLTEYREPALVSREIEGCRGTIPGRPVFMPYFLWDVRDDLLAFVSGNVDYEFQVRGRSSTRSIDRRIARGIGAREATEQLAVKAVGDTLTLQLPTGPCEIPPRVYVETWGFMPLIPTISAVRIGPERLWIQRDGGDDGRRIDLFDYDGQYTGSLPAAFPMPLVVYDDGSILVEETDDLGVERLIRLEVLRN